MKKIFRLNNIFLVSGFWFLVSVLCGCNSEKLYKDTQVLMGTFIQVTSPDARAAKIVFSEIERLERLFNRYDPQSEISRLNQLGRTRVSQDTLSLIKLAKQVTSDTDGAFDITVAPLLDIWGFSNKQYRIPQKIEIEEKLKLVGSEKIIINEDDNIIEFAARNMSIDLGAIAKGYAVDSAVKKLKENGIQSALINAGGDIYCLGEKSGQPWEVAVRAARAPGFIKEFKLKNKAIATSGDYERYFSVGNKRYAHIFNPSTGYPVEVEVLSVTVIADSCLIADALATGIFVLGKEKGEALAEKFNAEVADIAIQ